MSNNWIKALKELNKGKDCFCIPKKGSDEYKKTIKIMNEQDEKKKAGSFLSNIIKSRLQEEKHLEKALKEEMLPVHYGRIVDTYKKPRKDKAEREKKTKEIKDEYKKIFNKDMDTDEKTILKNRKMWSNRIKEFDYRRIRDEQNEDLKKMGIKKRYTFDEIKNKYRGTNDFLGFRV